MKITVDRTGRGDPTALLWLQTEHKAEGPAHNLELKHVDLRPY